MHNKKHTEEAKRKISETMKEKGGNSGTWKKGQKAWNYEGKGKLKRKFKRFNGKLILNSHVVWLEFHNLKTIPKEYVIHHIDGNSLNDNIGNLEIMTSLEHKKLHIKKSKIIAGDLK
ncbi:hypothetical protein LCGC14_3006290 [marine sediment metagenome]|uniref:HNH nuclease domain-containing protein n=1 Tax=marine sediment metagenome TaxID=412755 RepID=A0A0F8X009_9ZZZZ